jgi:hypothetical protein
MTALMRWCRPTTRQKRVWMPPANPGTRARAPLPSLRPLQVLLVYGGGFGVLLYIGFWGPRRWTLVSQRPPTPKYDFELEKRSLYAL